MPVGDTIHLTGYVTDDIGAGVSNVTISAHLGLQRVVTTISSEDGSYQFVFDVRELEFAGGFYVLARKDGYEPNDQLVNVGTRPMQDFRLRPILRLGPNEEYELKIEQADSLCGLASEFRCRMLRVAAPASGTLRIEIRSNSPGSAGLEIGAPYYACCAPINTIDLEAGVELRVHPVVEWNGTFPRSVTVRTTFTPASEPEVTRGGRGISKSQVSLW